MLLKFLVNSFPSGAPGPEARSWRNGGVGYLATGLVGFEVALG